MALSLLWLERAKQESHKKSIWNHILGAENGLILLWGKKKLGVY